MRVTIIGCPFKTSYGAAFESLKKAMERKSGSTVEWVASNCGCFDDAEVNRQFQMPGQKYFDMVNIGDYDSAKKWKLWLRLKARSVGYYFRARKYRHLSEGAEVVNFQQNLNAYGSTVIFHWLNQASPAARLVTVHELDRHQLDRPESNKIYNKADGIIVQLESMKDQLVQLGVDAKKIELVLHGTDLPPLNGNHAREGFIFYGGHHPMKGKGLHALLDAMVTLKNRLEKKPRLKVHGFFGGDDLASVNALIAQKGLQNDVVLLNQIPIADAMREYSSSQICVLPFMGSFAGLAAATAAAVETPVIGTRNAGIPEHLGDCGVWLDSDKSDQIVDRIEKLLSSDDLRRDLSKRSRKRAEEHLSWDIIADKTLAVYDRAMGRKKAAMATN
jgi:glycosyltransferase involved in cell wall biosynthesis